jgi:hypothetical protein
VTTKTSIDDSLVTHLTPGSECGPTEGEACLRDMEHEREEQRRKYKRVTAAETAGRLAAEATAGAYHLLTFVHVFTPHLSCLM